MDKRSLTFFAVGALALSASANQNELSEPCISKNDSVASSNLNLSEINTDPLIPSYLDGAYKDENWKSNWFLSVRGGVSSFVGSPLGCSDVFDRQKFSIAADLGKWITPYVGVRLAYQGWEFKNYQKFDCKYQNFHTDIMYNISSHFQGGAEINPRFDIIPYVGVGIIRNEYNHHKPFALSGGIIAQFRVSNRIKVSAELGTTGTFADFDGIGKNNRFGDYLLNAGIGLSCTIGKVGWKRVVDADPYISQNGALINGINGLKEENIKLRKQLTNDEMSIAEMKKILEIEGLLNKYKLHYTSVNDPKAYPKNNYSGLNSLRARLRNRNWNGDVENYTPELASNFNEEKDSETNNVYGAKDFLSNDYLKQISEGKTFIGSPIFFFFKLGTNTLVDKSQKINAVEIANVMKKYNLHAKIYGAADSETGTDEINNELSKKRADAILKILKDNGVSENMISITARGGISRYDPAEGNRHTCVMLYIK